MVKRHALAEEEPALYLFVFGYFDVGILVFVVELVHGIGEVNGLVFSLFVVGFDEGEDEFVSKVSDSVTSLDEGNRGARISAEDIDLEVKVLIVEGNTGCDS